MTAEKINAVASAWLRVLTRSAIVFSFLVPPAAAFNVEEDTTRESQLVLTIDAASGYIAFSPDGTRLAGKVSGATWRATDVALWEVATGKEVLTLEGYTDGIWQVAFSPTGTRLAANDNYTVKVWDFEAGETVCEFDAPAFTRSVVFTSDGRTLATGHDDGLIRLWDVKTSRMSRTLKGHTDWVPGLTISPDGKLLASGSVDLTARLWDLETGKEVHSLRGHKWYLTSVAFGPNGRRLVSGSDDSTAKIWDLEKGRELFTLRGHSDWVRRVAFSPDGRWVATASSDHTAKVWHAATGKEAVAIYHTDVVSCVAFSPDGSLLATASHDKTIKLWDVQSFASGG